MRDETLQRRHRHAPGQERLFQNPTQKDTNIDIISSAFENTALEANCEYAPYTDDLGQDQARALQPGPSITKYKHLKVCNSVTDVQFELRSGSGDQGLIATMEAILSVPASRIRPALIVGSTLVTLRLLLVLSLLSTLGLLDLWLLVAMLLPPLRGLQLSDEAHFCWV